MKREHLIMPERETTVRETNLEEVALSGNLRVRSRNCERVLTRPRAAQRKLAHTKPNGSYDGRWQTAAVNRFDFGRQDLPVKRRLVQSRSLL